MNDIAVVKHPQSRRTPTAFLRSRLTIIAPTAPNIENAMMYGTCAPRGSSLAATSTVPTIAIAMNPARTNQGQLARRSSGVIMTPAPGRCR